MRTHAGTRSTLEWPHNPNPNGPRHLLKPMSVRLRQVFGFRSCLSFAAASRPPSNEDSPLSRRFVTRRFEAKLRYQPVVKLQLRSAGDASPLTALLLPQIWAIFSVVAPCQRGASPASVRRWTFTTGC